METEVLSRRENPLLDRIEIEFRTRHAREPTPTRDALREEIAKIAKAKKDLVIIDRMDSDFGKPETTGYAKVYKSKEKALSVERKHILIRNGLLKPEKEPAKKKPEPEKEVPAEAGKKEPEAAETKPDKEESKEG
ncbi:MAG: 30S ribosomal protein S24e [Thermoplasmata archaeon]|nr:30S ribosomal protein S24e [Thermoplasmata archaeon]